MFKPSMFRILTTSLAAVLTLCSPLALAGKDDLKLPIKVDSKFNFVDGKLKISTFTEDVHITQGSLSIHADEVKVIAGEKGNEVFIAKGNPATYQQTLDDGKMVKASANQIKYQVLDRTLELTGSAELQQNNSQVKGTSIVFNMIQQQLVAQGESSSGERVTTIFTPGDIKTLKEERDEKEQQEDKP